MKLSDLADKQIHFIGLGGAGMSGIARIMLARGISVSGSDAKDSAVLSGLKTLGADHLALKLFPSEIIAGHLYLGSYK